MDEYIHTYIHTYMHACMQTDRQTDKQTNIVHGSLSVIVVPALSMAFLHKSVGKFIISFGYTGSLTVHDYLLILYFNGLSMYFL